MAPPTTTPPTPDPVPLDGTIDWLTHAVSQVVHWVTWTFSVRHLAEAAVIGAPLFALLTALRLWHLKRLLASRVAWAIIPTERYSRRLTDELVTNIGKMMSQVRRRAVGLRWWLRPASAIRFRLDPLGHAGTIYSIGGPPWAREIMETAYVTGIILCPMDALDLGELTPKGLYVPTEDATEPDTVTPPDDVPVPAGW